MRLRSFSRCEPSAEKRQAHHPSEAIMARPIGNGASAATLNSAMIECDANATLTVGLQPYDEARLRALREEHRGTHFFRREGPLLASVVTAAGHSPIGDRTEERELGGAMSLVASLTLDALLRYFHSHGRPISRYKPLRILSSRTEDLLLRRSLPPNAAVPEWIEQRVAYLFDTRLVFPPKKAPSAILACDVKVANMIGGSCSDLLAAGVPLVGKYVQVASADGDPRLTPKPQLVGRVDHVQRDGTTAMLHLGDHEAGYESIDAEMALLEPRHENIELCIRHLAPDQATEVLAKLDGLASAVTRGRDRLRRIRSMIDHLRSQRMEIVPGLTIGLSELMKEGVGDTWFPRKETIQKPPLVFSPLPGRTDRWNERGLSTHGPYDARGFTPKRPRVAVICEAEEQGTVEQFLRKFIDGMPDVQTGRGRSARSPYEQGFVRRYALEGVDLVHFPCRTSSPADYREACNQAVQHAADRGFSWNLAIVQIRDVFHQLSGDENPYWVTKAVLMRHHIPVQGVTVEKMASPASDLVFILNDVSLACYAKLGGTPWLLSAEPTIAHELVVGIGSHHMTGSRIGAHERVVGITTVFSGDGRYLLESRTSAVPYAQYHTAILDTLRRAIGRVRVDNNWRSEDSVRLIFHGFKESRNAEVDAVAKLMKEMALPHAEYAFVHLVDDHPFLAFDERNDGAFAPGGARKGVFVPERGTAIKFNRDEVLVNFTGSREVKQASDGMPRPIMLRLHRNSTFKDTTYLARQAFGFSCHSWRGFSPAPLPITILYSEQIAKMLKNLEGVAGWDPDVMLGKIGTTRWFL